MYLKEEDYLKYVKNKTELNKIGREAMQEALKKATF
jgi:hypothetical protein